jgi:hypothetical protein
MTEQSVSRVAVAHRLMTAALMIETEGWARHSVRSPEGCWCAAGAIIYAGAPAEAERPIVLFDREARDAFGDAALSAFADYLNAHRDELGVDPVGELPGPDPLFRHDTIAMWNDHYARSAAEVVDRLGQAAMWVWRVGAVGELPGQSVLEFTLKLPEASAS